MLKNNVYINSSLGYWSDDFDDFHSQSSFTVNIIPDSTIDNKKDLISISSDNYVPQAGDKIYFLPGVNVPRVKFKNLCSETGIKTVRDAEKANVFIGNDTSVEKLICHTWCYPVKKEDLQKFINLPKFTEIIDGHYVEKLQDAIDFTTEEFMYVDRPISRMITTYISSEESESVAIYYIDPNYKEIFDSLKNFKVHSESTIIDQLNGEDAAVIDKDIYGQLSNMLSSSDQDNIVLAMEIMANCKYSSSLNYLILLFYYHGNAIYNSHTKNHVNFKSLVGWMGRSNVDSYDVITILKEKNALTPENLDHIFSYIGKDVANRGTTGVYKVKTITLAPELLKEMNINYSYQLEQEFIPEPEVIQEEVQEDMTIYEIVSDEDIEAALKSIETNSAEEEALALEDASFFSESELNKTEEVSNNHQIEEKNGGDDFEWF